MNSTEKIRSDLRFLFLMILVVAVFTIGGCSLFQKQPIPVARNFPDATPELMKKCESLKTIQGDKVAITEMLKTIVENYTLYYQCSLKVDGWQEWYDTQKKIFSEIK